MDWLVVVVGLVGVCAGAGAGRARPLPWRAFRNVDTSQGTVRGYLGARYYAFLGIPYAAKLSPEDRFKAPEPPPTWDGIFEATYRIRCPQSGDGGTGGGGGVEGEENCLVANVFVREDAPAQLPVMVHIHDGGFQDGWGDLQPPIRLLQDFIVVTFNYRLGTLGFLCLGTPEAPGNAGLKDQLAALDWVQQNIANFGGSPTNITVFGTGSGAISAQILILSGLAQGFIHKVIVDSGSLLSPTAMSYDPYKTALNTAISMGYEDNGDVDELVEFYRTQPLTELTRIATNFLPCVESSHLYAHSLISQEPKLILRQGTFEKVPMMIVYTKTDKIQVIDDNYDKFTYVPEFFEDMLPNNLEFDTEDTQIKIGELVKDFYFDDRFKDTQKTVESYKEYINDIFMEYPIHKFAVLYAAKTTVPVFLMRFAADGDNVGSYGEVTHIIFAKDLPESNWLTADKLIMLWTNFMRIDDPTPITTELVPVIWESVNPHGLDAVGMDQPCLLLSHKEATLGLPPSSAQITFWDNIYSKYYRKHDFDEESSSFN